MKLPVVITVSLAWEKTFEDKTQYCTLNLKYYRKYYILLISHIILQNYFKHIKARVSLLTSYLILLFIKLSIYRIFLKKKTLIKNLAHILHSWPLVESKDSSRNKSKVLTKQNIHNMTFNLHKENVAKYLAH